MQVYNGGLIQNYMAGNKAAYVKPAVDEEKNPYAGSTDSVELAASLAALRLADDNGDGVVDRQEMANAAYQLLNDETSTAEEKAIGNMFATMVLGGADEKGLFADFNDDGGVTANELTLLAKGDDTADSIGAQDFKQAFGTRYKAGGVEFVLEDLKAAAKAPAGKDETAKDNGYGNTDTSKGNQNNGNANQDNNAQVIQILTGITEILSKLAAGGAGTPNGPQNQPQNGYGQVQNGNGQVQNGGQVPNGGGQPKNNGAQQPNGNNNNASGNPMMLMMQIFSSLLQMLMKMFAGK